MDVCAARSAFLAHRLCPHTCVGALGRVLQGHQGGWEQGTRRNSVWFDCGRLISSRTRRALGWTAPMPQLEQREADGAQQHFR